MLKMHFSNQLEWLFSSELGLDILDPIRTKQ